MRKNISRTCPNSGGPSSREATIANLDSMLASYGPNGERLHEDPREARRIIALRQLDPSDPSQMRIGRDWMDQARPKPITYQGPAASEIDDDYQS